MATVSPSPVFRSDVICDQYPFSSSVRYPVHWIKSRFQLLGVRDLVTHPLTVGQLIQRPYLRRSRYQLRVVDLATGKERTIYQRLLKQHYRECPLRVGIYEGRKLVELLTTNYGPTVADRRGLVRFLAKFIDHDLGDHRLGIFSDDCEVVTSGSMAQLGTVSR